MPAAPFGENPALRSYLRYFLPGALLYALASTAPASAEGGQLDGRILSQNLRETGHVEVCLCQSAVRICFPKPVTESMAVLVPDQSDGGLDLMMMGQSKVQ